MRRVGEAGRRRLALLLAVGALGTAFALHLVPGGPSPGSEGGAWSLEKAGVRVALELVARRDAGPVRPGGPADLLLTVVDAASGVRWTGADPLAWASPAAGPPLGDDACADRIRTLAGGSLSTQATTSLNQHYVYTLNGDNTLSVVNPLLAFQRTRLRDLVTLGGRPSDAVEGFDADTLYVALPDAEAVALVDTLTNRVRGSLDVEGRPTRLERQPGGARVWAADAAGGWIVLDTVAEAVAGRIAGPPGADAIAFDVDGARAFVATEGGLAAVDTGTLAILASRRLDAAAVALAEAPLAGALVLADAAGGLSLIDARTLETRSTTPLAPGIAAVGVDPSGRWAFAVHGALGRAAIVDTATGGPAGAVEVPEGSDELVFTEAFAYVTGAGADRIAAIPLQPLHAGEPVAAASVLAGTPAPDARRTALRGPSIAPLPRGDGVLVARPADRTLLYYAEGMNAPLGGIGNSSPSPAAGLVVVDRGLREIGPGVHRVGVTLPAGTWDVPVLLASPRTTMCFRLRVGEEPPPAPPAVAVGPARASVRAGAPERLSLRLSRGGEAVDGLEDVRVLVVRAGSNWQRRVPARPAGDGAYVADIQVPAAGAYRALVESRALGVAFGDLPAMRLDAEDGGKP